MNLLCEDRNGFNKNTTMSILSRSIARDGSLILKIYYDRKEYTVELLDYNDTILKTEIVKYQ